uniref:Uncharacterized protein n=1 Tax=Rhizophora mucronata TaxID=61149 RepID=A0A2P2P4Q3_RHIMU
MVLWCFEPIWDTILYPVFVVRLDSCRFSSSRCQCST